MTSHRSYDAVLTKVDKPATGSNGDAVSMTSYPPGEVKEDQSKETDKSCCSYLHKPAWLLFAICMLCFVQCSDVVEAGVYITDPNLLPGPTFYVPIRRTISEPQDQTTFSDHGEAAVTDGFVNTCVTSIERRFELTSTQSGIIISLNPFTGVFVTLFAGYFGGRGHKAHWIAAGMGLYAIGSFLFALPHFLSDPYRYDPTHASSYLCSSASEEAGEGFNSTSDHTTTDEVSGTSGYLYYFVIGQVLMGIGGAPLFPIGIAYLDENVSVRRSGLYIGILYTMACLGPAAGYIIGGLLLNTYTDIRVSHEVTMTPDEPGWVGAWWMGMLVASPLALAAAAFMLLFPRELPGSEELRSQKISVAHSRSGYDTLKTRPDFGEKPSDFFVALWLLIKNPTLMFLSGVAIFGAMLTMGLATYLPKILETSFGQTASFSAAVVGATVVIGGSGGSFLGGWLVRKYCWDIKQNITFCIVISIWSVFVLLIFLLRCPDLADVSTDDSFETCLSSCACLTQQHHPVCSTDGLTEYFSPCHAGCTQYFSTNNTFGGCSCVPGTTMVLEGTCGSLDCPQLIVFIIGLFICIFSGFVVAAPALHATLRCVPESQRSFALGFTAVLVKIFGSFPAPIIFGAIFDSTCAVWQADESGQDGSCWIYDTRKLSNRLLIICEILVIAELTGYIFSIYFYNSVTSEDEKVEDESKNRE